MRQQPFFAVVGATGQQGGAVARALLRRGARVRALTRNATSDGAQALAAAGAELVIADLTDRDSVVAAFTGVDAAFAMTTFGERGTEGEVADGRTIGDAAVAARLPRMLYSSVGGAERHTGIPHFDSKREVELYLQARLPVSFVRPTFFMDNLAASLQPSDDAEVVVRFPLPGNIALQLVAVRDVGEVSAAALLDPSRLEGDVEIAGDELTGDQIARAIGTHLGKPGRYEELPLEVLGEDEDRRAMFRWFAELPAYQADFAATRALDPDVYDLTRWLAQHD